MGHWFAEDLARLGNPDAPKPVCPQCGLDSSHWELVDYDEMWRDGKIICECGHLIRYYDAG